VGSADDPRRYQTGDLARLSCRLACHESKQIRQQALAVGRRERVRRAL
jgi:hypothetical protein